MIERVQLLRPRYRDPRPDTKRGQVRIALMRLLDQHRRNGALPTSMRFLFYELIGQRVISKHQAHARQLVSGALTDLREGRHVPWDDIVDETREVSDFTGSASLADDWLQYLNSARLDPWDGDVPIIITESRSLAGVLRALCSDYRIRITSTNGQCSGFLHTELAPVLQTDNRVGYLGDYDLAGSDIEGNTRRVLEGIVGDPVETEALSQSRIVDMVRTWLDDLLRSSGSACWYANGASASTCAR